jgi:hypothetical protein
MLLPADPFRQTVTEQPQAAACGCFYFQHLLLTKGDNI